MASQADHNGAARLNTPLKPKHTVHCVLDMHLDERRAYSSVFNREAGRYACQFKYNDDVCTYHNSHSQASYCKVRVELTHPDCATQPAGPKTLVLMEEHIALPREIPDSVDGMVVVSAPHGIAVAQVMHATPTADGRRKTQPRICVTKVTVNVSPDPVATRRLFKCIHKAMRAHKAETDVYLMDKQMARDHKRRRDMEHTASKRVCSFVSVARKVAASAQDPDSSLL